MGYGRATRRAGLAALAVTVLLTSAQVAAAGDTRSSAFPASGELIEPAVAIRAKPDPGSTVLRRMTQVRADFQIQVVLALGAKRGTDGSLWYRLSLPGRPNGQRGWVRSDEVDIRPVANRIIVDLSARTIEVRRVANRRLLLRGVAAIGKPGAETPLGRNYFVQSRFVPTDRFFGTFALETSAYSRLTDWPGGGVVGIHGTSLPQLLGQAVSHGCVRVHNSVATRLKKLAPVGTVIDVVR